jgi:hypothetical protein
MTVSPIGAVGRALPDIDTGLDVALSGTPSSFTLGVSVSGFHAARSAVRYLEGRRVLSVPGRPTLQEDLP